MSQSMVCITTNEQREYYFRALSKKVAEFKSFNADVFNKKISTSPEVSSDIEKYLREAISFKNMFDIKSAKVSLTRDDVNLIVRILNTSV